MKKNIPVIIVLLCILSFPLFPAKFKPQKRENGKDAHKILVYGTLLAGYAIPINASYIDTYINDDIYWNPNSGFNLDLRLRIQFNPYLALSLQVDTVIGFYKYKTTDGRKINTEAQAGTTPSTTNKEWSFAPNFVPSIQVKPGKHPAIPYIAIGLGLGLMWSFESWLFVNVDGDNAKLIIRKLYWPTPLFKGEIGWNIPVSKKLEFRISGVFNLANYMMRKVKLTHYYINNTDTIGLYDEKDTIYSYAFDTPDENKGGDCLLAGFAYQNYLQQKISTNITLKIGLAYKF